MARYKHNDYNQTKMIPLRFADQIQPGSFEYTLSHVVDHDLDMSLFESRYRNDYNGAPAYDPAVLLKIVLFAYSRGITSSRKIAEACRENVLFMVLSADSQPHHSTIAEFITRMDDVIAPLFTQVLMVCDGMNLIGREMFAIDGCKMPSNAAKEWSGTRAELNRKQAKIDRAVARMLQAHQSSDNTDQQPEITERQQAQIKKLEEVSAKIKKHLATEPERLGQRGRPVKSNITDNDSAKMTKGSGTLWSEARRESLKDETNKSAKGVIQGYNGVAAVDSKHQIIVHAQAQEGRQVSFYPKGNAPEVSFMDRMKEKIDSPMGRHIYSQRLGTVEPVFGNLESNKGLNDLRSEAKRRSAHNG
nr:transposase [Amphritea pacifica]